MRKAFWTTVAALGVLLSTGLYFFGPVGEPVEVELYPGEPLDSLCARAERAGAVRSGGFLRALMSALGVDRRVQAGVYRLFKGENELRVALKVKRGPSRTLEVRATIRPGWDTYKIAGYLARVLGTDSARLFALTRDSAFIDSLARKFPELKGLKSLEGFIFPETYSFYKRQDPRSVLAKTVAQHFEFWTPQRRELLSQRGITLYQAVILASLVEREAVADSERPIIASVFYNRLKRGMPLAANSALGYALRKPAAWLTAKDLEAETPYNTYKHPGLPPTPICSPGPKSLEAVLKPAKTNYLYFVADGRGGHWFSETYAQHRRNVRKARRIFRR